MNKYILISTFIFLPISINCQLDNSYHKTFTFSNCEDSNLLYSQDLSTLNNNLEQNAIDFIHFPIYTKSHFNNFYNPEIINSEDVLILVKKDNCLNINQEEFEFFNTICALSRLGTTFELTQSVPINSINCITEEELKSDVNQIIGNTQYDNIILIHDYEFGRPFERARNIELNSNTNIWLIKENEILETDQIDYFVLIHEAIHNKIRSTNILDSHSGYNENPYNILASCAASSVFFNTFLALKLHHDDIKEKIEANNSNCFCNSNINHHKCQLFSKKSDIFTLQFPFNFEELEIIDSPIICDNSQFIDSILTIIEEFETDNTLTYTSPNKYKSSTYEKHSQSEILNFYLKENTTTSDTSFWEILKNKLIKDREMPELIESLISEINDLYKMEYQYVNNDVQVLSNLYTKLEEAHLKRTGNKLRKLNKSSFIKTRLKSYVEVEIQKRIYILQYLKGINKEQNVNILRSSMKRKIKRILRNN